MYAKVENRLSVKYMSELMDKGGSFYGGDGGVLVDWNLGFEDSGLSFAISHRQASGSGWKERRRLDYLAIYNTTLAPDEVYATAVTAKAIYHHFYESRALSNGEEVEIGLAWNQLIPGDLGLYYVMACERVSDTGDAGFYHVAGISKTISINGEATANPAAFRLYLESAYRDGLGGDSVRGRSHTTTGIAYSVAFQNGFQATAEIAHQFSTEKAGNPDDVTFGSLSVSKSF